MSTNITKKIPYILVVATTAYLGGFLYRSGSVNLIDEGLVWEGAQRILSGQIMYRDFFGWVAPGTFYLLALFWKIFGMQIWVAKMLTIAIGVGNAFLLYKINQRLLSNTIALGIAIFFTVFIYPIHIIISYHWLSLLFVLWSSLWILRWLEQGKKQYLLVSGILLGIACIFALTRGGLIGIATIIFFLTHSRHQGQTRFWHTILYWGLGVVIPLVIVVALFSPYINPYTIWQQSLLHNIGYYQNFNNDLVRTQELTIYLVIASVLLSHLVLKNKELRHGRWLYVLLLSLSMLPYALYRIDINHIAYILPVFFLSLVGLLMTELFKKIKLSNTYQVKYYLHILRLVLVFLILIPYFLLVVPYNYFFYNKKYWNYIDTRVGTLYEHSRDVYSQILDDIYKIPDKKIFIYPLSAHFYPLSGKINSTKYSIIYSEYFSYQQKEELKQELLASEQNYIVYLPAEAGAEEEKFLGPFIEEHYQLISQKSYPNYPNIFYYIYKKSR